MIEVIFTLDYEIYGNGTGALKELVLDPAEQLRRIFQKWDARFVAFIEVAELERIEEAGTDNAIDAVKQQVADLHRDDFEIALHLHPQWYNARYERGKWRLDDTEYNLCKLSRPRISEIVDRSLGYLGCLVDEPGFAPLSFRAGNWLFQPTRTAADILAQRGIRIDSSVFKGGVQRNHGLDYRGALRNGYYWPFHDDATTPDPNGSWLELPIYTEMVPSWRMVTAKRMGLNNSVGMAGRGAGYKWNRIADFLRFRYPLKFDFCRMTFNELAIVAERILRQEKEKPEVYKPIVAIGHTKDLADPNTVDAFLGFLRRKGIPISTFEGIKTELFGKNVASTPVLRDAHVEAPGSY